jgi:hypothetical protein
LKGGAVRTRTGHLIGAVYESAYWGGTYRVLAETGDGAVEVECLAPGRGAHQTPGERWAHRTQLDRRDRLIVNPAEDGEQEG